MAEWRDISDAPNSRLVLAWLDGWEYHSDVHWYRCGFALVVLHDGELAPHSLDEARRRLIGKDSTNEWNLKANWWMPLPEPPDTPAEPSSEGSAVVSSKED